MQHLFSNNVGGVKQFSSTLLHSLVKERHFALVDDLRVFRFAEPDSPRAIYLHNLLTGSTSRVPGSEGWFSPRISPDGRSFLALSVDEHKLALYDFEEEKWRVLVDSKKDKLENPSWPLDGKSAYINVYGTEHYLARIGISKGTLQKVISYRDLSVSPYCWTFGVAPDASLLISCYHLNSNIYALQYE